MIRRALLLSSLLVASAAPAFSQTDYKSNAPSSPPPLTRSDARIGSSTPSRTRVTAIVAIGDPAPDFELDDVTGAHVRMRDLRGGWVALFFAESREAMGSLAGVREQLQSLHVQVIGVCEDKSQALAKSARDHSWAFTALSDPTGDVAALYGLLDSERGVARPGFVLIDPVGIVRMAVLGQALPVDDASRLVQYAITGS